MIRRLATAFFLFFMLAGCAQETAPPKSTQVKRDSILIGLIPEQNIFNQIERYEPLADYISGKTGVKVRLKILRRYGNIIDNFNSAGLDGAFFGSFTYELAHAKLGVEVLARPVAPDNTSTYHGLIFVRKDSRIRNVGDMKGKRFALVDKATTAGYLLPLKYFHSHGVPNFREYLKESYFTGTHEDAIYDVLNGKADIGAAKNTVFNRIAAADPRIREELVVLERSPDVPENALALRKDMDESMRRRLGEALLNMHQDPDGKKVLERFGAIKFIETRNSDYAAVVRYAEAAHLDLSTYDYSND
jgi:phosphonate transport system substrate-binding protein